MRKFAVLVLTALLVFGTIGGAYATVLNATSGGWSITVDTVRQGFPIEGLIDWVDPFGNDHMWEESWWGRNNTTSTKENPLSSLTLLSSSNPAPNQILLKYREENDLLYIDLLYSLVGSGPSSWVSETMTLTNASQNPTNQSVFEYTDFDLSDTYDDDSAYGDINGITQYDNLTLANVTPISNIPNYFQITSFPLLVDSLSDAALTNLDNSGSPFGPEDATFAFQWNFSLGPGGTYTIEKLKTVHIVPEPATLSLLGLGVLGVLGLKRKKS
jgi:hypothetical protein